MRATLEESRTARRVLLWGVTGSGKSTLAQAAAARLGVRYVDGDAIGWRPGWVTAPVDEQRSEVSAILSAEDGWVFDTAWSTWRDLVLPSTDLVVGLDYSRGVSLGWLVRRTVLRSVNRTPICNGNVETWRRTFSRESIIAWHFRNFAEKRSQLSAWESDQTMPPVLRLSRPSQAAAWLASLG